jgi:polyhydroxyalkanoate synthesis regulator phasin
MNRNKQEEAVNRVTELLEELSKPGAMTVEEALKFYEGVASWLEGSIEGLKTDLEETV